MKSKNIAVGFILALIIIVGGISMAGSSYAATETPQFMGADCSKGELAFYGQLTGTRSEQKLCKISDSEWYFSTKANEDKEPSGTKVFKVEPISTTGTMGFTKGYKLTLSMGDVVTLVAGYNEHGKLPVSGFFIINSDVMSLDPMSIVVK